MEANTQAKFPPELAFPQKFHEPIDLKDSWGWDLFTDGGCEPNPGLGGWSYILKDWNSGRKFQGWGTYGHTTNNRMELVAVIRGLERLPEPCCVYLESDSTYVVNGLNRWIFGWAKAGFRDRANKDLWRRLWELKRFHKEIQAVHVKGHSRHQENNWCHWQVQLARWEFKDPKNRRLIRLTT